jgi:hypothetical protein
MPGPEHNFYGSPNVGDWVRDSVPESAIPFGGGLTLQDLKYNGHIAVETTFNQPTDSSEPDDEYDIPVTLVA